MIEGKVAIVGRPNVGKSTIFNRIIGTRLSIVSDEPGVTRDRLYGRASWLTKEFSIIDTGGVEMADHPFQQQIRAQVEIAVNEADVIVVICDVRTGVTPDDELVARLVQKAHKPVILAVNRVDDTKFKDDIFEFYKLGLGDPIPVSGLHGVGIGDLLDAIIHAFPKKKEEEEIEGEIKFCLIGRPNVGKSSLVNALLQQDRVIVSNIEGTTRDSIDTPFTKDGRNYTVIDTAGLRKRGMIYEAVDKYAALRALSAIDRSDVVLLIIDGGTGIREQDKNIAGYAIDAGKAIIIVVNKWDIVNKDEKTMSQFTKNIRKEFQFIDYAPVVYCSALTKSRISTIYQAIDIAFDNTTKRVATSALNAIMMDAQQLNPAPAFNGDRIKIKYANQVAIKPPTFVLFVNNPIYLHFSYKRYLENRIRESFGFEGTPIKIIPRTSE
ncbi:MAG: ribosome biogenesis GTPase Der [Bacilli bacterium]|nr:ribosome biogenesis GTPase Der [Bacilli bacterium]